MDIGGTLFYWVSGLIIFLAGALIMGMRKRAQSDVSSLGGFIAGALLFHPMRVIRGQASLYLTAFDYANCWQGGGRRAQPGFLLS